MEKRIFGIETEFGCMARDPSAGTSEEIVEQVKDCAFYEKKLGVIDLHARDYAFEPARAGGFLRNGGRLYDRRTMDAARGRRDDRNLAHDPRHNHDRLRIPVHRRA